MSIYLSSIYSFTYLFINHRDYIPLFRLKDDGNIFTHKESLLPNEANLVYQTLYD